MIRRLVSIILAIVTIMVIMLQIWSRHMNLTYDFSSFIYWLILLNWLMVISVHKLSSKVSLFIGLAILLTFSVLHSLTISYIFEPMLRIGMVFWIVGMAQLSFEFAKTKHHD